jgi:selenoprotein W-related protein
LAAKIREQAGVRAVKLVPSSGGAFEVRLNGDLLHSKLETGEWPDFDALAQQIRAHK